MTCLPSLGGCWLNPVVSRGGARTGEKSWRVGAGRTAQFDELGSVALFRLPSSFFFFVYATLVIIMYLCFWYCFAAVPFPRVPLLFCFGGEEMSHHIFVSWMRRWVWRVQKVSRRTTVRRVTQNCNLVSCLVNACLEAPCFVGLLFHEQVPRKGLNRCSVEDGGGGGALTAEAGRG